MELAVGRPGPAAPFRSARDVFMTEWDLALPVKVDVRSDPAERTRVTHYEDRHVLTISEQAARSALARELALHEYAHMRRYEEGHPSHTQSTGEAVLLALAGRRVERRTVAHCYQIANHMKDIYADDLTFAVGDPGKLVRFFEQELARALADRPRARRVGWRRETPASDPEITAVNAAFALALLERHGCLAPGDALYDLAYAAARDAPGIRLEWFRDRFRSLEADPSPTAYRRALVTVAGEYAARTSRDQDQDQDQDQNQDQNQDRAV